MSYIGIPPFGQTIRTITNATATASQTTFNITGGYIVGYVDVYLNGVLLTPSDYTATDGLTVVLSTGAALNDEFQAISYQPVSLTNALPTVGGTLTGDVTTTANINFGDNDKAQFGASNDLQIYHDGSNSYIYEAGTGNLLLRGSAAIRLQRHDGTENFLTCDQDAAVTLYYNGAAKLATTSTGVDVTGTVVSDGLTVDTNTLYVDSANNKVGIGTTSPSGYNSAMNNLVAYGSGDSGITIASGTASEGSLAFADGTTGNEAYRGWINYNHGSDFMRMFTAGSERMRIDSSGNVGIGTSNPSFKVDLKMSSSARTGGLVIRRSTNDNHQLGLWTDSGAMYFDAITDNAGAAGVTIFRRSLNTGTSFTESMRIDSSGNVGIGTTSPIEILNIKQSNTATHSTTLTKGTNTPGIWIENSNNNDNTSGIYFSTGGSLHFSGIVGARTNTSHWGTHLAFYTHLNNTSSLNTSTEKMRIDGDGNVLVGRTDAGAGNAGGKIASNGFIEAVVNGDVCFSANRKNDDGILMLFQQQNTTEGNISVSGTTVSYNGGHLSRWSQLVDGTKDESIVKGTVMTNLDKMAKWVKDGVEEDNEQLNCMAVSSVEGDPNVAGVFVNWDNNDDFNDMNIAMTGDMIIRIAQGTTVERGNLLMSAGDGTAKPQEDDIVRSKTIAKVTSTHVSCTYSDGSYCVPCVLMAC